VAGGTTFSLPFFLRYECTLHLQFFCFPQAQPLSSPSFIRSHCGDQIRAPIGSDQHLRDVSSINERLHDVSSSDSIEYELVYSPTEGGRWPFFTWAHHPRRLFSKPFQTSSLSAELLQIALCNQPFDISLTDIELRILGKIDCATYLISKLWSEIYI
jgi:hypothetical protein